MRLLLTLSCLPSLGLANEMPEGAETFDRGEITDRETRTLDEWMEEYGEALPSGEQRLSPKTEPSDSPPFPSPPEGVPPEAPPTGEEFSGDLQPFTVTLVDKTQAAGASYAVSGCAPNQRVNMLDDGVAPDTRSGDGEYTAMSTLCPFGSTPVVVLEGDTPLWQQSFEPPTETSAPSLRLLRSNTGVSKDTASDQVQPPAQAPPADPQPAGPGNDEPAPREVPGLLWLLAGAAIGYGIRALQGRKDTAVPRPPLRTPVEKTPAARVSQDSTPANPMALGTELLHTIQAPTSLRVDGRQSQRSLTLSLAQHFAKQGRVLLIPHPDNQHFYPSKIPKSSDVIWFRGPRPRLQEIQDTLTDRDAPIVCVLIEGMAALDVGRKQRQTIKEELSRLSDSCLILIQLSKETAALETAFDCVLSDGRWELSP